VAERLDELLGGRGSREVALVTRVVTNFHAKALGLAEIMSEAGSAGDDEATAAAAHSLKGAAVNIGAVAVARLCEELEAVARTRSAQWVLPRLPRLRVILDEFEDELRAVCERFPELTPARETPGRRGE